MKARFEAYESKSAPRSGKRCNPSTRLRNLWIVILFISLVGSVFVGTYWRRYLPIFTPREKQLYFSAAMLKLLLISLFINLIITTSIMAADTFGTNTQSWTTPVKQTDTSGYYNQGKHYIENREWDKAINNFDKAILLDPTNAMGYEYRGGCYFAKGDLEKAISDYSLQIQLDPTNEAAYLNKGNAYRAKQEYDKAMIDLNECLRLNPTNAIAYKTRAAIHHSKREYDQEISDWSQGLRLTPNDATALELRGFAYFMTSQFGKAIDDYKKAIQLNPTNDLAYNNLGWLRATCPVAEMRNGREAIEAAMRACEFTHWTSGQWIDTLAAAYAEAGDFEKAVRCEKQAMTANGTDTKGLADMQRHLSMYENRQPNHDGQKQ